MSSFYHKYFEGYEEVTVPDKDGKGAQIERKYAGIYYRQGVTGLIWYLVRFFYTAVFFCALSLFYNASTQPLGCNTTPYATVSQALTVLSFIWFAWVLLHYVSTKSDMKIYTYKSTSPKLIRAGMTAAGAFCLNALSVLVYVVLNLQDEPRKQLLCLAEYVVGGGCLFLVNRLEKAMPYEKILNPDRYNAGR